MHGILNVTQQVNVFALYYLFTLSVLFDDVDDDKINDHPSPRTFPTIFRLFALLLEFVFSVRLFHPPYAAHWQWFIVMDNAVLFVSCEFFQSTYFHILPLFCCLFFVCFCFVYCSISASVCFFACGFVCLFHVNTVNNGVNK